MSQQHKDYTNPELQPEGETEVVAPDALEVLQRAEIDMQIATAKKWPRSIKQFMQDAQSMISLDTETAEACNYKLKRKERDGGVKVIEGPSIRLMEIAASSFQNVRYGSRVISTEGTFVTCQGVASDMQRNVHCSVEVKRRITTKDGRRYSDDMVMVTANAGGSIARRNALKGIIPVAYINQLSEYAKKIAIGDIKSLPERRQRAVEYFTKVLGVDISRVLAYCEKKALEDLDLADVEDLQGLKTALKEGDIKLEEAFADTAPVKQPDMGNKTPATYPAGGGPTPSAPATATTTEPAAAATTPTPKTDPLPEVLKLMAKDSITEAQLLTYLRGVKAIDESLGSLQEVAMVAPSALDNSITGWKVIKAALTKKEAK